MLFAKSKGRMWQFCDPTLEAFWRREFDLESELAIEAALLQAGLSATDWQSYRTDRATQDLRTADQHAEDLGVFGAPTFVYERELFWGCDRLELLAKTIDEARA